MKTRPFINIEKTWINILSLMNKSGITKKDLSIVFGISVQAIHQKFSPKALPTVEQLVIMSDIFEQPIEKILITENIPADDEYQEIINRAHENNKAKYLYNLHDLNAPNIVGENVETYFRDFFQYHGI